MKAPTQLTSIGERSTSRGEPEMRVRALTVVSLVISFLRRSRKMGKQVDSSDFRWSPRLQMIWPLIGIKEKKAKWWFRRRMAYVGFICPLIWYNMKYEIRIYFSIYFTRSSQGKFHSITVWLRLLLSWTLTNFVTGYSLLHLGVIQYR